MKLSLLRSIALVGLLFTLSNVRQQVAAQEVPEPTVDDGFRDGAGTGPESSLLVPPSSPAQPVEDLPIANSAPSADAQRPYLGVTFNTQVRGAMVKTVKPGSPAEQAGVHPGDTIEKLQGQQIQSYQDVLDIVATMRPGDLLDIECSRKCSVSVKCEIAALPVLVPHNVAYPPNAAGGVGHEVLPVPAGAIVAPPAVAPRVVGPRLNPPGPLPRPGMLPPVRRFGPGPPGPIVPGPRRGFGFRR